MKPLKLQKQMSNELAPKYYGITYPSILRSRLIRSLWKRYYCKRNIHLFDECLSVGYPWHHFLVCDCCQLMIYIDRIDDKYCRHITK